MKFSQKTITSREYALWAGMALSVVISIIVIFAIFDIYEMRENVKDIQTFLGGLSVLAASLYSFYASSAAAAETFRKNSKDEEILRKNIRVNMVLIAETLRLQSHLRLNDLNFYTENYTLGKIHFKRYAELTITIPDYAEKIWENIGIIQQDTQLQYLNLINFANIFNQDLKSGLESCTFLRNEHSSMLAKLDRAVTEKIIIENSLVENINKFGIESNNIEWVRISKLLANVNNLSIGFLKKMEESSVWQPDQPPYPPNFEAHEYTKPSR